MTSNYLNIANQLGKNKPNNPMQNQKPAPNMFGATSTQTQNKVAKQGSGLMNLVLSRHGPRNTSREVASLSARISLTPVEIYTIFENAKSLPLNTYQCLKVARDDIAKSTLQLRSHGIPDDQIANSRPRLA